MEEICRSLCAKLCETGTGEYSIFYEDELLDALPDDLKNRETLEAALKKLNTDGFIDVKYARGNAFCIAAVKEYKVKEIPETAPAASQPEENDRTVCLNRRAFVAVALCAFAGSAIGGIILAIIGAII